jgi:hypothetical protein
VCNGWTTVGALITGGPVNDNHPTQIPSGPTGAIIQGGTVGDPKQTSGPTGARDVRCWLGPTSQVR